MFLCNFYVWLCIDKILNVLVWYSVGINLFYFWWFWGGYCVIEIDLIVNG